MNNASNGLVKRGGAYYTPCGKVEVTLHTKTRHSKRDGGVGGSTIRKSRTHRWYFVKFVGAPILTAKSADTLVDAAVLAAEMAK